MKPIEFPEQNKTLTRPGEMTDDECGSLHVYAAPEDAPQPVLISCWQASWRERFSILFFGRVWLYVVARKTQPPVSLEAVRTVFQQGVGQKGGK